MPVSLVTCVSNKGGLGPGHSCIDIDGKIFTFQGIDWGGDNSGWEQVARDKYLAKNAHRPVILQELTPAVHAGKVLDYILESIADDDDYLGSGVCSSQAASAIEAGYEGAFDPVGLDMPYVLYRLAKSKRIVARESRHWDESRCNFMVKALIKGQLSGL